MICGNNGGVHRIGHPHTHIVGDSPTHCDPRQTFNDVHLQYLITCLHKYQLSFNLCSRLARIQSPPTPYRPLDHGPELIPPANMIAAQRAATTGVSQLALCAPRVNGRARAPTHRPGCPCCSGKAHRDICAAPRASVATAEVATTTEAPAAQPEIINFSTTNRDAYVTRRHEVVLQRWVRCASPTTHSCTTAAPPPAHQPPTTQTSSIPIAPRLPTAFLRPQFAPPAAPRHRQPPMAQPATKHDTHTP